MIDPLTLNLHTEDGRKALNRAIAERLGYSVYHYDKGYNDYYMLMDPSWNPAWESFTGIRFSEVSKAGIRAGERKTEAEAWLDAPDWTGDLELALTLRPYKAIGMSVLPSGFISVTAPSLIGLESVVPPLSVPPAVRYCVAWYQLEQERPAFDEVVMEAVTALYRQFGTEYTRAYRSGDTAAQASIYQSLDEAMNQLAAQHHTTAAALDEQYRQWREMQDAERRDGDA